MWSVQPNCRMSHCHKTFSVLSAQSRFIVIYSLLLFAATFPSVMGKQPCPLQMASSDMQHEAENRTGQYSHPNRLVMAEHRTTVLFSHSCQTVGTVEFSPEWKVHETVL